MRLRFFFSYRNFLQRIHAEICSGGLVSALSFRIRTGSLSESVPVSRTSGGDYADGALYYSSLFIDRPCRFIPAFLGLYLLNTYFSFVVKGAEFGYIDMINGFVSGGLGFMIGTALIIMRLKSFEVEDQLIREKTTDVLTGVWNRRKLFEAIDRIKEGKGNPPFRVFMVDVDHFKDFNDIYGHAAGDECLHEMGKLFLSLQQQDRVIFYRYGGEEFVVFLYDCSDKDIRETAENIRKSAAEMQVCGRRVTVSIGTVYCDDLSVADYEVWISRADKAAYAAKKNSRNIVVSWNERQQMRH